MHKKFYFTMLFVAVLAFSCKPSANQLEQEITAAEEASYQGFDTMALNQLCDLYQQFTKSYPQETMAAEYLFRYGCTQMRLGKGTAALSGFDKIINNYPNFEKLPEVYFYRAYTYETAIYDIAMAKEAYSLLIEKFPEHPLVKDAQLSIQYLGKTPEEIIASWEQTDTMEEEQDYLEETIE